MTHDVCVLMHRLTEKRDLPSWVITHLVEIWAKQGLSVEILFGTERFVPARVLLVHVDLTVVPDEYLEFAARYPVALNGRVKDIRKSRISANLVRPGDGYDGKVIVKADLNCAGGPERLLAGRGAVLETGTPRYPFPIRGQQDYRIYDRPGDVPPEYYRHPFLVVERFRPEIENGLYHTRHYLFLGEAENANRNVSRHPVVFSASKIRTEVVEPHPEVRALRRKLGMDYGKIDYTVHEGEVAVFDVNKTTGAPNWMTSPKIVAARQHRAAGIYGFLGRPAPENP
jgi:hypothetical protein